MYPTLGLQAAALALAVLMTMAPMPVQPAEDTAKAVIRTSAPAQPELLHCRLYFGCAPLRKGRLEGARD